MIDKNYFFMDIKKLVQGESAVEIGVGILIIQFLLLFLLLQLPNPIWFFFVLCSLFFIPFIIASPGYFFLILIIYISILPNPDWGQKYDFFKYYVSWKLVVLMLIGIIAIISIRGLYESRWRIRFELLDKLILLFLAYTFFNAIWGFYQNGNINNIIFEFYYIWLYLAYFIVRFLLQNEKWIKHFIIALIFSAAIAAIGYVMLTLSMMDIKDIFINRVTTQQPHLALLAIPFLIGVIFFIRNKFYKLISTLFMVPIFLMVILSQQRSLYVSILISLIAMLFFYYFRSGFEISRLFKLIVGIFSLVISIVVFLIILEKYFHLNFFITVAARLGTLQDVAADQSWRIRFTEVSIALDQWKEHIFIGSGLGSTFPKIFSFRGNSGLDNSYAFILWKLGICGLFLFICIYVVFLYQGFYSFWNTWESHRKLVISSLISGMIGMLVIAITNMSIIKYRFNLIWAAVIAIIHYYYQNSLKQND